MAHKHMMPSGEMMIGKRHEEGETYGSKKGRSVKPKRKMKKREIRSKRS